MGVQYIQNQQLHEHLHGKTKNIMKIGLF